MYILAPKKNIYVSWQNQNMLWVLNNIFFCLGNSGDYQFVCVEVLRPSQLNGVMLSTVSLPNHTFTVQA